MLALTPQDCHNAIAILGNNLSIMWISCLIMHDIICEKYQVNAGSCTQRTKVCRNTQHTRAHASLIRHFSSSHVLWAAHSLSTSYIISHPLSTTSKSTCSSPSDAHVQSKLQVLFKVKWHIYCSIYRFLIHWTCIKWCYCFLLGFYFISDMSLMKFWALCP